MIPGISFPKSSTQEKGISKEKADEQTSSVILECGKRHHKLMLIPTNSFTCPALFYVVVVDMPGSWKSGEE